jgi:hypothetical protein
MTQLPPVLDACCGPRMMWFDKNDPRALFIDRRRETHDLQAYMNAADALLFLRGRIYFERGTRPGANASGGVTTSPPFGIVLCAYGEPMAKALIESKLMGVRAKVIG